MSRRKARMLGIAAIGVILMLLAVVLFERARGTNQLEEVLGRLRAAQVEIDPTKVVTHSVPDAENAAVALWEITDELRAFSLPEGGERIRAMNYVAPGEACSYVGSNSWESTTGERYEWEQLGETAGEAGEWLERLKVISKAPRFATVSDISKVGADMELRSLAALPNVMRILRFVTLVSLNEGKGKEAMDAATTLLDLYANKSEDPWVISEFVRWNLSRTAMTLTWELLQHATRPDADWEQLQSSWERCNFVNTYATVARAELAMMSDFFVRLKGSNEYRQHILDNFDQIEQQGTGYWDPIVRGALLRRFHVPVWRLMWADQDYAYSMAHHHTEVQLASFAGKNSWKAVRIEAAQHDRADEGFGPIPPYREKGLYDRARYLFSRPPSMPALFKSNLLRAFQAETEARLVVTAIALQRYSMAEGRYPEKLEELVPRFLAQVPTDPMDGEALKYRRLEDGNNLLYSSGVDGEDDGGSAELEDESSAPNLWNGADAVWPRRVEPAT